MPKAEKVKIRNEDKMLSKSVCLHIVIKLRVLQSGVGWRAEDLAGPFSGLPRELRLKVLGWSHLQEMG